MNIDQATQDAETLSEETPDIETLEESLIELAHKLGCEEAVEHYLNENDENTEADNQTSEEETLFEPQYYTLDTTLVRVRMKERNLALTDLQEQLGVAYRTLTRWLSKDDFPQHQNLVKLADVLDIELYQLVIKKSMEGTILMKEMMHYAISKDVSKPSSPKSLKTKKHQRRKNLAHSSNTTTSFSKQQNEIGQHVTNSII